MQELMGPGEFGAFLDSYKKPPVRGIRLNRLKARGGLAAEALALAGGHAPVPWCPDGYSFTGGARPALSPLYHAGLFYLQEPSAMCPAEALAPGPRDRVLDLCAAPGGKTAQLAGHMRGGGLLVANDSSAARCRGLVRNVELAGAANVVVLAEEPRRLAAAFPDFFDRILVDAPCSGEGMFRKSREAARAYAANKPEKCAAVQSGLLRLAARMLRPGGVMAYSTCTFNPVENERVVAGFLRERVDFGMAEISLAGTSPGREEWAGARAPGLSRGAARIWPHEADAEGHFVALLAKAGAAGGRPAARGGPPMFPEEFRGFAAANLDAAAAGIWAQRRLEAFGGRLYLVPESLGPGALRGLRVARGGLFLGEAKKGRFEPSHALALALAPGMAALSAELTAADAQRYLKGESLPAENAAGKPWALVCHRGLALGWARAVGGRLKNCLPRNWALP